MAHKFANVHVIIFYDYVSRHYMVVIKGTPDKCVMSCAQQLEELKSSGEIEKILAWANGEDSN